MDLHVVTSSTQPPALRRGDRALRRDRQVASQCLSAAQRRVGAPQERRTNDDGAPRPSSGWHWSWSHTRGRVAAVVGREPIGLDLEALNRAPSAALLSSASAAELALLPAASDAWRLRLWTAKEARLKQLGHGLGALSRCRLVAPPEGNALLPNATTFTLELDGERCDVLQIDIEQHSLALAVSTVDSVEIHAHTPSAATLEVAR